MATRERGARAARDYRLQNKYGITLNRYEQKVKEQDSRCAICNKVASLVVDHDHETGVVRALLCHECNTGLGLFQESIRNLASAIVYLEEHGKRFS